MNCSEGNSQGSRNALKILIIPSWYPSPELPTYGIFVQDQCLVLNKIHHVAVLKPGVEAFRSLWEQRLRLADTLEDEQGILTARCYARPWIPRFGFAWFLARRRAARHGLERLLQVWGRPDILHAHVVLPAGWVAVSLGRRYGIPVVLTEHSSPFAMHLRTKWQRKLVRKTLEECAAVVAVSPGLACQIRDAGYDGPMEVIGNVLLDDQNGGFQESPKVNRDGDTLSIAFVGGLVWQKGVVFLLRALQRLVSKEILVHLYLAGDGSLRQELEQEARELGISGHCTFLGRLPRRQVYNLISQCDFLVAPSLHETFCIAVAEAMARGKPVVATRSGGPEHFVPPEAGRLVQPGDVDDLAEAIEDVISRLTQFDPNLIRRLVVERFGESAFIEQINKVYERTLVS